MRKHIWFSEKDSAENAEQRDVPAVLSIGADVGNKGRHGSTEHKSTAGARGQLVCAFPGELLLSM